MVDEKESVVEQQVIALAEQLGRFVGTVQRKADGWLDRQAITDEVTRIRDEASSLLEQIGGAKTSPPQRGGGQKKKNATQRASPSKGRSGGAVDAPGKKHRKPAPSARGAKHSDQRISKIVGAKTLRRGQRRG